jgi:hypothetical protein
MRSAWAKGLAWVAVAAAAAAIGCGGLAVVEREGGGGGVACGPATCGADEVCCNESCGICTAPGDTCTTQACE